MDGSYSFWFKIDGTKLIENQDEILVIQKAKRMKREGKTYRAIAESLNISLGYVHKINKSQFKERKI